MSDTDDEISLKQAAQYATPEPPEHECQGLRNGCSVCARAQSTGTLDVMLAASRAGKVVRK